MEQWKGKVAVITGASAGIGAALAEALVIAGLEVVGIARRKEKIEEIARKLQPFGKLHAVKADLTKEEDILKAFQWIKDNVGPVYILINNAGITRMSTLWNGNTQAWKEIFDINVLALCIATKEAIKGMMANQIDGHIVHISSITGHVVPNLPDMGIYPGTKYAIGAIAQRLRQELANIGSKIKISIVSPSLTDTEMLTTSATVSGCSEAIDGIKEYVKCSPCLQTEDVVKAVCYVLSTPSHIQIQDLIIKAVGEKF